MVKFFNKKNVSKKKDSDNFFSLIKNKICSIKNKLSFLSFLDPFTYVDLWVMPFVKKQTNNSQIAEFLVNLFFAFVFALSLYFLLGFLFNSASPLVIVYSASMEPFFFRGDIIALGGINEEDYFGEEIIFQDSIKVRNIPTVDYATPIYSNSSTPSLEKIVFNCGENCVKELVPTKEGTVIVYPAINPLTPIHNIPIIHRSIAKIVSSDGNFVLTKGDNYLTNPTFDADCGGVNTELGFSQKNCITLYAIPVESIQGKAFFKIPFLGCFKLWLVDDLSSLLFTQKLPSDFRGIC